MDIWILDENYEALTLVDIFDSVVWTTRFNDVCEAEIVTYPFSNILEYVQMGRYLMQRNSDRYMIIEDMEIVEGVEDGDTVTLRVEDLSSILKRRVINKYTTFKCGVQTAVKSLIYDYFISPSDVARKMPLFTFEEASGAVFNTEIETVFLGETVFDAVVALCQAVNIGFKVVPFGQGGVKFVLYSGSDRSYNQSTLPAVIFSETFENLVNSRYREATINQKNVMYIGGEGDGPDQFITEIHSGSSVPTGLNRREVWTEISASRRTDREDDSGNPIDLTDAEYAALLSEKGRVELAEYAAVQMFDGKIDAERQFILDRDFFLGDIVQVINKWGYESVCRIVEIVESEDDSDGHMYYPTFSSLERNI